MNALPPLPRTPMDAITDLVRERVILGDTTFLIDRPDDSDGLINHPAIRAAFAADEYLPYWADLWPAARMLAKAVLAEPWAAAREGEAPAEPFGRAARPEPRPPGLPALRAGCGPRPPGTRPPAPPAAVRLPDY